MNNLSSYCGLFDAKTSASDKDLSVLKQDTSPHDLRIMTLLRCYSCAPCNEMEIYAGDVTHFEQDCYLDRYCMKVRLRSLFFSL